MICFYPISEQVNIFFIHVVFAVRGAKWYSKLREVPLHDLGEFPPESFLKHSVVLKLLSKYPYHGK